MPRPPEDFNANPQADQSSRDEPLSEHLERRRQVRGLLLLALAAIIFAIIRAGVHRVFTTGWWRLW